MQEGYKHIRRRTQGIRPACALAISNTTAFHSICLCYVQYMHPAVNKLSAAAATHQARDGMNTQLQGKSRLGRRHQPLEPSHVDTLANMHVCMHVLHTYKQPINNRPAGIRSACMHAPDHAQCLPCDANTRLLAIVPLSIHTPLMHLASMHAINAIRASNSCLRVAWLIKSARVFHACI